MRDYDSRRQIIKNLENCNKGFYHRKRISPDEYRTNHRVLMSLISNEVFLTESQVKSLRKKLELSTDIIRFRALITIIQMCSN
jgi:hypothetical protein